MVVVKKLQWLEPSPNQNYPMWTASHFGTDFKATIDTSRARVFGKYPLEINGHDQGKKFITLQQAKDFAQAEFERRVLSALEFPLLDPKKVTYVDAFAVMGDDQDEDGNGGVWTVGIYSTFERASDAALHKNKTTSVRVGPYFFVKEIRVREGTLFDD